MKSRLGSLRARQSRRSSRRARAASNTTRRRYDPQESVDTARSEQAREGCLTEIDDEILDALEKAIQAWSTLRDGVAKIDAETNQNFKDDTFEPDESVEEPKQVHMNVLDTIEQSKAVAEAYRKIFKVSPFDREAKKEISEAIDALIRKWRSVQSTLAARTSDKPKTEAA
jgi:hypothetical protein